MKGFSFMQMCIWRNVNIKSHEKMFNLILRMLFECSTRLNTLSSHPWIINEVSFTEVAGSRLKHWSL